MTDESSKTADRLMVACMAGSSLLVSVEPISGVIGLATCTLLLNWRRGQIREEMLAAKSQAESAESKLRQAEARADKNAADLSVEKKKVAIYEERRLVVLGLIGVAALASAGALWVWLIQRRRLREDRKQLQRDLDEFLARWRRPAGEASPIHGDIPANLVCVITGDPFRDPVMCADGHTYEREAIRDWFNLGHTTSPLTNNSLEHLNLVSNHSLRGAVEEFVSRRSTASPSQ